MRIHKHLRSAAAREKIKTSLAYFTSWLNSIVYYKLRTIEAENP